MKNPLNRVASLLAFCLLATNVLSQNIYLTQPISVTGGIGNYGDHHPQIGVLANGNVIVSWSKIGTGGGLFYAIHDGTQFGPVNPVDVGTLTPWVFSLGAGPDMVVDGDNVYFIVVDNNIGVHLVRSLDGGATFETPVLIAANGTGFFQTFPGIDVDDQGVVNVNYMTRSLSGGTHVYYLAQSTDNGATFNTPVATTSNSTGNLCECCPADVLFDGNDRYMAFRNNDNTIRDTWMSKSTDAGQTWPNAIDVDEVDWLSNSCPTSGPTIHDAGAELVIAFYSGQGNVPGDGVYYTTVNKSNFLASSTLAMPTIDGIGTGQNHPKVAGSGDTLAMVWQESKGPNIEIGLTYSLTGASGLGSTILNVSDKSFHQRLPFILFDNGVFHLAYNDNETGSVIYRKAQFTEPVGIGETSINSAFNVYPNPTSNAITIDYTGAEQVARLQCYSVEGKLVQSATLRGNNSRVQLNLPAGTYFVQLEGTKGELLGQKVVLVH